MPTASVAILIVSYNVRAALARALASIPQGCEVVVVDNASADGTAAMVAQKFPHVRLIAQANNVGFAVAMNLAAKASSAKTLLWLNPDAWLPTGALESLLRAFERACAENPRAVVGPRQVDGQGRLQLAFGPTPSLLGELCRRTVQRRLDRPHERRAAWLRTALDALMATPKAVAWVAGSALMVQRSTFMEVGGLDPGYFLFFEDMDFCLRVRAAGGSIVYDPTVTVGHSRGVSASGARTLAARAYRDSQMRFASQHQGRCLALATRLWAAHKRPDAQPLP